MSLVRIQPTAGSVDMLLEAAGSALSVKLEAQQLLLGRSYAKRCKGLQYPISTAHMIHMIT